MQPQGEIGVADAEVVELQHERQHENLERHRNSGEEENPPETGGAHGAAHQGPGRHRGDDDERGPGTEIQAGWEQRFFYDLQGDEDGLPTGQLSGDFRGSALALQLTNQGQYLGYRLTTQLGVRLDVRSLEVAEGRRRTESSGLTFLSILAGIW